VNVQRRAAALVRGDAVIEAALDEGTASAGGRVEPLLELELELNAGAPAALFALARELTDVAGLDLAFDSKAERGYALLDGATGKPPEAAPPGSDTTATRAFQRAARASLAAAQTGAGSFIARPDPETLHQTRVALRRLRSLLSAFRPMLADARYDAVRADIRAVASGLNAARDLDVFDADVLRPAALAAEEERDGLAALGGAVAAARTVAYDQALAALDSDARRRAVLDVAAWLECGPWTEDASLAALRDTRATTFGAEVLDRLRRKLKRAGAHLGRLDAHDRHEVRIRAKKLRYAADAFAPLFPAHAKRRRRFFKALKALQEALGALNDRSVGRELALRVAAPGGPEAAFAAGRLTAARDADEAGLLAAAQAAYAALFAAKPFWR
jgi:inorganic triphosphatase YgiF